MVDDELLRGFWEFHALAHSRQRNERLASEEFRWAYDAVDEAMLAGGTQAVELLVALAEAAPDGDAAAYLGAGPVEDLLDEHGNEVVGLLDDAARRNRRLRLAFRSVIWSDRLSPETVARLRRYELPP